MGNHKAVYSFKEKEYAEKIIKEGFAHGVINYDSMRIIAKYLREEKGFGRVKLERALIEFCLLQNPDFNPVLERDSIKRWINVSMENKLRNISSVKITHNEMNVIKEIRDLKKRKILFAVLVMSKVMKAGRTLIKNNHSVSDKYYLHFSKFPNVIDRLGFFITETNFIKILSEFIDSGIISVYSPEKETLLINFANDEGPIAITVEADNIMEYYKIFFGGDISYCQNCGKEMVKASNSHSRCKECSSEIKREHTRKSMQKIRNVIQ